MQYVLLAAAFSLNALGNILLKAGSARGIVFSGPLMSIPGANWQLIAGVVFFGLNAICYFLALRSLPISIAYPIMVVMSFLLINAYALGVLGEQLSYVQVAGYACLVVGLVLIVAPAA